MTGRKAAATAFMVAVAIGVLTCAAEEPFVNDICLPSSLYMLSDTPNDMFVQPILKRWRPYNDFVRFDMEQKYGSFARRLGSVATIDKPQDGAIVSVDLVNGDE